jgi:hypothetical protein
LINNRAGDLSGGDRDIEKLEIDQLIVLVAN